MPRTHLLQLLFRYGVACIDLVAQYQEWYMFQPICGEQRCELTLSFLETLMIRHIDEEDDTVTCDEIGRPHGASCTMTTLGKEHTTRFGE